MSGAIELYFKKHPYVSNLKRLLQSVKLPLLEGISLYELLSMYTVGILEGAISYRAAAISFSFFMALFPFALFILNLIPYIPIQGFQQDFLQFISESVPPNTYEAISAIINDILNNSQSGLLSTGFILSIFLQANGLNAVMGGFEASKQIVIRRNVFRQYVVAIALSFLLNFMLIATVVIILVFEIFLQITKIQDVLSDQIQLLEVGRYASVILMLLLTVSVLFKFGIKRDKNRKFISIGSVFTTILIIISSFFFGIWAVQFSQYNELYGSIGTLLVLMFYIWINCIVLLLGFELDATIYSHKQNLMRQKQKTLL